MTLFSLLKQGKVRAAAGSKVIPADEYTELLSAKEITEQAQKDITQAFDENEKECEKLREAEKAHGYQDGLTTFNEHVLFLDAKVKEMEVELQKLVLPLALKAAKKIVTEQLKLNPETIVDIVLKTIRPVAEAHRIKILVSKEDKELLDKEKETIKQRLDVVEIFTIEERSEITQGGCIIETESGIINASIENQWRALEAAFETFAKNQHG
ncbi:MAG: FliH/SctL family protein [Simkaniaceae bacterium]|nr:FliH/SctL family protein [Simkaniaceae bacterium]